MRHFESGATRDSDEHKIDFEGFLSPVVLQAYGEYMLRHQVQADGALRGSDNWQAGMSRDVYMKSLLRHVHDLWLEHDGYPSREGLDEALGGLLFNAMGYWFETLKEESQEVMVDLSERLAQSDMRTCETCDYWLHFDVIGTKHQAHACMSLNVCAMFSEWKAKR